MSEQLGSPVTGVVYWLALKRLAPDNETTNKKAKCETIVNG